MEQHVIEIKRTSREKKARKLIFDKDFLSYEVKPGVTEIIQKQDIHELRYGINWISFRITYGREYQIFIRSIESKVIKISLKSYFGKNRTAQHEKYAEIINKLWEFYFHDIAQEHLSIFNKGEEVVIGDVHLTPSHLSYSVNQVMNVKRIDIPWKYVRTRNFYTYFSIFSEQDPENINRGYNYLEDWNTLVLNSVVRGILQHEGLETYDEK